MQSSLSTNSLNNCSTRFRPCASTLSSTPSHSAPDCTHHFQASPLILRHTYFLHACIYIYIYMHSFHKNEIIRSGIFYTFRPNSEELFTLQRAPLWFCFNFQRCSQFKTDMFKSACFWSPSPCMLQFTNKTSQWGTADAETAVPFTENPKVSIVLPFKARSGSNYSQACFVYWQDFDRTNFCIPGSYSQSSYESQVS